MVYDEFKDSMLRRQLGKLYKPISSMDDIGGLSATSG